MITDIFFTSNESGNAFVSIEFEEGNLHRFYLTEEGWQYYFKKPIPQGLNVFSLRSMLAGRIGEEAAEELIGIMI